MVQGLLSAGSSPRLSVNELKSENATRDVLLSTVQTILSRGCINADEVLKMDYLLNVGGATWYAEHLVRVCRTVFHHVKFSNRIRLFTGCCLTEIFQGRVRCYSTVWYSKYSLKLVMTFYHPKLANYVI